MTTFYISIICVLAGFYAGWYLHGKFGERISAAEKALKE